MKRFGQLLMMVLAVVVMFTACDTPESGDKVATPTVTLTLNAEEVTSDAFTAFAATTDAEKAAWKVVAHGDETVKFEVVMLEGIEIPSDQLNGETPAMIVVEGLEAETEYDLYVAVQNKGKKVLSEPLCVTTGKAAPAFSKTIEFYPALCEGMSLVDAGVGVGHYLTFVDESGNMMQVLVQDGTNDAMSYKYLPGQFYPAVTAALGNSASAGSAVICDPGYSNLCVIDPTTEEETTYALVGDKGAEYGVDIITVMPDQDNNMITFNLVGADEAGNEVLIVGQYTGPFGYPAAAAPIDFDLTEWGFTSFKATVDGNKVTLLSNGVSGDFKIMIDTTNYGGQVTSAEGNLYVVGDNLEGYYFDPLDFADYNFTEGGFVLLPGDKEGEYKLEVGERRGWKMGGGNKQFNIVPGIYTIQVEGLVEKNGSEFEDLNKGTVDSEF